MKPTIISSVVASPQVTFDVGSGFARLSAELSNFASTRIVVPAGITLGAVGV